MNWFLSNWQIILFCILAVIIIVYAVMTGKTVEWLKYAVAKAEEELGTGTGQLKLRKVYDWFIAKFPVFSKIVPFPIFSKWVDLALAWLNEQLSKNDFIRSKITGA